MPVDDWGFEKELIEAMTRLIEDAGSAPHLLPFMVPAGPGARNVAADLLWDEFVNGG